jgi:hypothetical protein
MHGTAVALHLHRHLSSLRGRDHLPVDRRSRQTVAIRANDDGQTSEERPVRVHDGHDGGPVLANECVGQSVHVGELLGVHHECIGARAVACFQNSGHHGQVRTRALFDRAGQSPMQYDPSGHDPRDDRDGDSGKQCTVQRERSWKQSAHWGLFHAARRCVSTGPALSTLAP